MLIRYRMTPNPVTITPEDSLAAAQEKMAAGRFRHLPVTQNDMLIGILTDRDIRRHLGTEERTKVVAALTENPLTISPATTVAEAAQLMLKHQISGLPVLEDGYLVGIMTTSDVMRAYVEGRRIAPDAVQFINELCLKGPRAEQYGNVGNDPDCRR